MTALEAYEAIKHPLLKHHIDKVEKTLNGDH
jgi:hypothetical protein